MQRSKSPLQKFKEMFSRSDGNYTPIQLGDESKPVYDPQRGWVVGGKKLAEDSKAVAPPPVVKKVEE